MVTAQLMKGNVPAGIEGIALAFSASNGSVAKVHEPSTVKTDKNGMATVKIDSSGTIGTVSVAVSDGKIEDSMAVNFISTSLSISGFVTDKNNVRVPGANVTLWITGTMDSNGTYKNLKIVNLKGSKNPQFSNNTTGAYGFNNVEPGTYRLTARIPGYSVYRDVTVDDSTVSMNLSIPDYAYAKK
jgi:protocatechuate 3,4-dioxygenase beta subunit